MKLDTCLFIMGLIALPLVFAHSCKVDARRAAQVTTREQLSYQEGYTIGYKAGKASQQDADYAEAMRQGREALAILEKWDRVKKPTSGYTLNGQAPLDACKGAK